MNWFNVYGMIFVVLLMVPNVIFAAANKDGFVNRYQNKTVELLEQIGRFGSFGFMVICLPFACRGWWFDGAKTAYITLPGAGLTAMYLAGWAVFWKEDSVRKSLALSVLPSLLFLESGVLTLNIPLIAAAVIFAPCHITISCRNAELAAAEKKTGIQE